jgi:predicted acylesterase/phospholipase RssA
VAHIGALKALEEAGIIIDHIGGNSAGAIISAGYAMGYSTDQLSALAKEMYRPRNFFDPTLPLVSLFSRWRMDRFAREILGDHQIEDLWLPFFCVSSNLTRAEIAVHDQGLMRRWVLASNSLPGLMPPVVKDGDLLLDGALLDNFPLDIMREKIGNGRVIGVDVSPPIDLAENPDFGLHLSGWRVLLSRINPLSTSIKMPGIAAILQRAGELSSKKNQRELLNSLAADLVIRPPVEKFSLTDATALDEIEALGYQSAVEQISAWQRGSGVIK